MSIHQRRAFTLVELLIVIGIIALLVAILLPALAAARESSRSVTCASNMRQVGQGLARYLAEEKQTYPASYQYNDFPGNTYAGLQFPNSEPQDPVAGYRHWSWFIYGEKRVPANAFTCPSLLEGGLPPTNARPEDKIAGQINDPATPDGVYDDQAPRMAYTANEAIMPRNKFHQGVARTGPGFLSRFVRATQVKQTQDVILLTEFWEDWTISSQFNGTDAIVKSHRPVHGFEGRNPAGGGSAYDFSYIAPDPLGGPGREEFDRVISVPYPPDPNGNRLNWVGRNHGVKSPKDKLTNFLYTDGHVETKRIEETLTDPRWQWGEEVYCLKGADVAP